MLGLSCEADYAEGKSGVKNLELSVVPSDVLDPAGPGQKWKGVEKKREKKKKSMSEEKAV